MDTVFEGDHPEVSALLARRKSLGLDGHDEAWEGKYHVVPHANARHSRVQYELARNLGPRVENKGFFLTVEFNLGGERDYRVPDLGVHVDDVTELFIPTAAAVIEVLSPGDRTYEKFAFFHSHDVDQILVVDPDAHDVSCFSRGPDDYAPTGTFTCAGLTTRELAQLIRWP